LSSSHAASVKRSRSAIVNALLYDRAKLLVGEPLFGVNLVGVLAGCFEELFVVVSLQMVTL